MRQLFFVLFFFSLSKSFAQPIAYEQFIKNSIGENDRKQHEISQLISGKRTIVYFWASWCAPCIESLNIIKSYYSSPGEKLQIITVCEDNNKKVNSFFANGNSTLHYYLFDTNSAILKKYHFSVVPTMLLLNNENHTLSLLEGSKITKNIISSFIANGRITGATDTVAKSVSAEDALKQFNPPASDSLNIAESPEILGSPSFIRYYDDTFAFRRITFVNFTLDGIYRYIYSFNYCRTQVLRGKKKNKGLEYKSFDVIVPRIDDDNYSHIKDYLKKYLTKKYPDFKVAIKKLRSDSCYLLLRKGDKPYPISTDPHERSFNTQNFFGKSVRYSEITSFLENSLNVPIENMTNDNNTYDINLHFINHDLKSLNSELEKYNISLEKIKNRPIKMLILNENFRE
jgi:thiol-disulfide isomerase/thioredoxin